MSEVDNGALYGQSVPLTQAERLTARPTVVGMDATGTTGTDDGGTTVSDSWTARHRA